MSGTTWLPALGGNEDWSLGTNGMWFDAESAMNGIMGHFFCGKKFG